MAHALARAGQACLSSSRNVSPISAAEAATFAAAFPRQRLTTAAGYMLAVAEDRAGDPRFAVSNRNALLTARALLDRQIHALEAV